MMNPFVVLVLLGAPLLVAAEEAAVDEENQFPQQMSARDLQRSCASSNLSGAGRQQRRYCTGFISGVEEGVRTLQNQHMLEMSICLPEKVSGRSLTSAFLKYASNHPKQLEQPASQVVIDALSQAYPCPR